MKNKNIGSFAAGLIVMLMLFLLLAFLELGREAHWRSRSEELIGQTSGEVNSNGATWEVYDSEHIMSNEVLKDICTSCKDTANRLAKSVILVINEDLYGYDESEYCEKYFIHSSPRCDGFFILVNSGSVTVYQYGGMVEYSKLNGRSTEKWVDVTPELDSVGIDGKIGVLKSNLDSTMDSVFEDIKKLVEVEEERYAKLWGIIDINEE